MDVLALHNVSFSYVAGTPILRNVSLAVNRGEFLAIVGPNGSGKSTLLKIMDGLWAPHQGKVLLQDKEISMYSRREIAKLVAVVPQDHQAQFPFTVLELVLMGRAPHVRGLAFESSHDHDIATAMMEKTDIAHLAAKPITSLSGGERQRAFIARALAQQSPIILLDEPNAHLDIAHQLEIFGVMKSMNREHGVTVVAVSHDLNLAASFGDRIAMLLCGGLVAIGPPEDVLTTERIREVFQAEVLVDRHPIYDAPRVTLATQLSEGISIGPQSEVVPEGRN
jgi:iron complex transport system ATP-binding protein